MPPSSAVLKTLWPRMQKYSITSKSDVLYSTCENGANGDEAKARECLTDWAARIPAIVAALNALKTELNRNFPVSNGYSGSCWNEAGERLDICVHIATSASSCVRLLSFSLSCVAVASVQITTSKTGRQAFGVKPTIPSYLLSS